VSVHEDLVDTDAELLDALAILSRHKNIRRLSAEEMNDLLTQIEHAELNGPTYIVVPGLMSPAMRHAYFASEAFRYEMNHLPYYYLSNGHPIRWMPGDHRKPWNASSIIRFAQYLVESGQVCQP
jgi:hypothetical protein